MKKYMTILLAALAFAACDDDNGGDTPRDTIEITGGSTSQIIYANQNAAEDGGGVTFTTSGPWRAEVVDISDSRADAAPSVDWVTLSQTSGDAAGEYTIQITLAMNTTGRDRKAEIRIICGSTVITITVEQRGTTEGGKPLRLVAAIAYEPQYCSAEEYRYNDPMTFSFGYDDLGRVAVMRQTVHDDDASYYLESVLDRSVRGQIRVTDTEDNGQSETYTLTLNDNGSIARAETDDYEGHHTYDFSYTDGRLTEIAWESYSSLRRNVYTYADGVFSSFFEYNGDYRVDSVKHAEEGFGPHANDLLNIDPNALFLVIDGYDSDNFNGSSQMFMGRLDRCMLLDLIGKRCDRLVAMNDLGDSDLMSPVKRYTTPNTVVNEERTYTSSHLDPNLEYAFDTDGYITTITQSESVEKIRTTWKVQVTDQLINPYNPEEGYEWYEIKGSRQDETLDSGTNRYVYTFQYE